jgi:hypothetical protein
MADPMAVRRSKPSLRRPYAAAAAGASLLFVIVAVIVVGRPISWSGSAAAERGPVFAGAAGPAAATPAPGERARGDTGTSPAMPFPDDDASSEDGDLLAWVEWKYRYLIEDAQLDPASRRELVRLLTAREWLVRGPDAANQRDKLADIERQLEALLGAADRERYKALRESDAEQHRLGDYGGGIEQLAPLDDDQTRKLLIAKLRHKAIFERELAEAHLDRPALSADERARAHLIINAAIDHYRDAFLRDAAAILDEQQLVLLTSYETTEMELERQRLQVVINAR